ncbi:MAG: membrane protein insertase YidC [Pseudomonadota bacterium]
MDEQTRNLLMASGLSFLVILVWFALFPPPVPEEPLPETVAETTTTDGEVTLPVTPNQLATPQVQREAALAESPRVEIESDRVSGSFRLQGALIDDLRLTDYNVELNDSSEKFTLLSPVQPNAGYWIFNAWWSPGKSVEPAMLPNASTEWQVAEGARLTPSTPVTLTWDNGAGLNFTRKISLDENYMFTVEQTVTNATGGAIDIAAYAALTRKGEPDVRGFFILHEGHIASFNGELEQVTYDNVTEQDDSKSPGVHRETYTVTEGGWTGFTDHYWMANLIPQDTPVFTSVTEWNAAANRYQTDVQYPAVIVKDGGSHTVVTKVFAGAKEYDAIREYEDKYGVPQFIDSIDWGWFFFLTKPIFQVLHWLNQLIGNMGWAIIALTLIIKAILFPLAYRSYVMMAKMKDLQPEMEKIKERVGDDRQAMQQEMMKLYREKKVNPASGCLPILLQIPIFFSLYKVIFVTIELRHAPFIWWIKDLSAPDPTSFWNLFGLLPFSTPGPESFFILFSIGVFPILMGITMWLQQKLNPAPTDPTQATIFAWMPWVFMFMLGSFASGLVLYWVANNTITFIQQYVIMRSQGMKPDVFGNIRKSFKRRDKAKE